MKSFILQETLIFQQPFLLFFFLKCKIFTSAEGNKTLHLRSECSQIVKVVKLRCVRKMEKEKEKQKEWILSNSKVCKRCKQSYDPNSNTSTSCRFHPSFFVCRRHDDQKRYPTLFPSNSLIYPFSFSFSDLQFLFIILLKIPFFPSFL